MVPGIVTRAVWTEKPPGQIRIVVGSSPDTWVLEWRCRCGGRPRWHYKELRRRVDRLILKRPEGFDFYL